MTGRPALLAVAVLPAIATAARTGRHPCGAHQHGNDRQNEDHEKQDVFIDTQHLELPRMMLPDPPRRPSCATNRAFP
jgi:hypothetical protein